MIMRPNQRAIRESNVRYRVVTTVIIQRVTTMTYVRFKVTICLYLSPNNKAKSLSTLMAAIVIKDIKHNPYPEMEVASHANRQSLHCSWTTEIQRFGDERLAYQTNQQISCCQTTIQEFGRRMERRYLVKCNKDQRIPKKCCKGKKNVGC